MKLSALFLLVCVIFGRASANAQTYSFSVLHTFSDGPDGALPYWGSLVQDPAGNFYGTTNIGGAQQGGALYELSPASGTLTPLFAFAGSTGIEPVSGIIRDAAGNLYGVTSNGGDLGAGAVYKIAPGGSATTLHSFGDSAES